MIDLLIRDLRIDKADDVFRSRDTDGNSGRLTHRRADRDGDAQDIGGNMRLVQADHGQVAACDDLRDIANFRKQPARDIVQRDSTRARNSGSIA